MLDLSVASRPSSGDGSLRAWLLEQAKKEAEKEAKKAEAEAEKAEADAKAETQRLQSKIDSLQEELAYRDSGLNDGDY
jgi:hypothetical protein